jgi:hypothetical protein
MATDVHDSSCAGPIREIRSRAAAECNCAATGQVHLHGVGQPQKEADMKGMNRSIGITLGLATITLVASGCGAGSPRVTFDGASCGYDGPRNLKPGDVEVAFDNESGEYAALAFLSMPSDADVRASEEALVGQDFPIAGDPAPGSEIVGTILAEPGKTVTEMAPLPAGSFVVDCATFTGEQPTHAWRAVVLDVSD